MGFITRSEIAGFWPKTYQILQFTDIPKRCSRHKINALRVVQTGPNIVINQQSQSVCAKIEAKMAEKGISRASKVTLFVTLSVFAAGLIYEYGELPEPNLTVSYEAIATTYYNDGRHPKIDVLDDVYGSKGDCLKKNVDAARYLAAMLESINRIEIDCSQRSGHTASR